MRGLAGIMDSMDLSSGRQQRAEEPGELQSMGSKRSDAT